MAASSPPECPDFHEQMDRLALRLKELKNDVGEMGSTVNVDVLTKLYHSNPAEVGPELKELKVMFREMNKTIVELHQELKEMVGGDAFVPEHLRELKRMEELDLAEDAV